jgi:hypothetical protein
MSFAWASWDNIFLSFKSKHECYSFFEVFFKNPGKIDHTFL